MSGAKEDFTHRGDGPVSYRREYATIDYVHDFGIDPAKGELFLFGRDELSSFVAGEGEAEPDLEYSVANQFLKNLRILQGLSSDPILIHMKTCGGDWTQGIAIYEAIRACPNHTVILNYASARSMSSIILQAADRRAMMPLSTFMFHRGENGLVGTGTQVDTAYAEMKRADQQMYDIYVRSLKKAKRFKNVAEKGIERWLLDEMKAKEDVFLTAEEAVELNFADMIFGARGKYDWAKLKEF